MTLVERARIFATAAHAAVAQKRKYTLEPYIVHPAEVVEIVRSVPHTEEMLAAAWLHDVVEDTQVSLQDIETEFGRPVAELVMWLTDLPTSAGNRAYRKQATIRRLSEAPAEAQTVKLADLVSNTSSIMQHDPSFAKVYLAEKAEALAVLTKGDATLHARAVANL